MDESTALRIKDFREQDGVKEGNKTIYASTDYDKFKFLECNRAVSPTRLEAMVESLNTINLLEQNPIIVDEELNIIDGQGRFMAAKKLGLPIFYTVLHKSAESREVLKILNVKQVQWVPNDYLEYYVSLGNKNYIRFKEFIKEYKLSISCGLTYVRGSGSHSAKKIFSIGSLIFDATEEIRELASAAHKIVEILSIRGTKSRIAKEQRFHEAIKEFLSCPAVDRKNFIEKVESAPQKMRKMATKWDYIEMCVDIYNTSKRSKRLGIIKDGKKSKLIGLGNK